MGLVWFLEAHQLACVAGVRKGKGRELGRETRREGGGRRGTPARKPLFSPSRLLIKKVTKITQLWMTSCQISLAAMHVFWSYFLHCFSFVFLKQEIVSKGTIKKFKCGRPSKESSLKVATMGAELEDIVQHESIQVVAKGIGLENYLIRHVAALRNFQCNVCLTSKQVACFFLSFFWRVTPTSRWEMILFRTSQ